MDKFDPKKKPKTGLKQLGHGLGLLRMRSKVVPSASSATHRACVLYEMERATTWSS